MVVPKWFTKKYAAQMWSDFQTNWAQFEQSSNTKEKTIEERVLAGCSNLRGSYFIETSRILTLMDKVREIAPMDAWVGTNMRSAELDKILAKLKERIEVRRNHHEFSGRKWRGDLDHKHRRMAFYLHCALTIYYQDTEKTPERVLSAIKNTNGLPAIWEKLTRLQSRRIQDDADGGKSDGVLNFFFRKRGYAGSNSNQKQKGFTKDQMALLGFLGVKAVVQVAKLAIREVDLARERGTPFDFNQFFVKTLRKIDAMK